MLVIALALGEFLDIILVINIKTSIDFFIEAVFKNGHFYGHQNIRMHEQCRLTYTIVCETIMNKYVNRVKFVKISIERNI